MEGHLDVDILKKLGCDKERVKKADALFFFQLLLPLCDTSKSGVQDDPRMNYYTEVSKLTNMYAYLSGQGSDYGHVFKNTSAQPLNLCNVARGVAKAPAPSSEPSTS